MWSRDLDSAALRVAHNREYNARVIVDEKFSALGSRVSVYVSERFFFFTYQIIYYLNE